MRDSALSRRCSQALPPLLAMATLGAQTVDYGRDVRPLLADRCYACHGPDSATRKAGLRLDLRADAVEDRDGFPAIVPGDPEASELILRVRDDVDPMPPGPDHEPLDAHELRLLEEWIRAGAAYDVHWAYDPPRARELPAVRDGDWPATGVDRFLLARLEAEGIAPAPLADPRTRVRRLSFDLHGLPPTEAQVAAFEANPTGDAWGALVESMLASPHHAERLTTMWFDLVRFADTTGIHADNTWHVSPYRDWVLDAFAHNMPFDRFTVEQLAGDLLPDATVEQNVAAAYNRLNLVTREGGSQPKEFLARYTADRVRNVSEVWLATTLGCAECHDHKFDPLTAREFYEFGAFFADIEQVGVYLQASENNFAPELDVPSDEQAAELARIEERLASLSVTLAAESAALDRDQREWEASLRQPPWSAPEGIAFASDGDIVASADAKGVFTVTAGTAEADRYRLTFPLPDEPVRALRLELIESDALPNRGPGRAKNGNVVLSEVEVSIDGEPVRIARAEASYEQPGYGIAAAHDGKPGRSGWAVMRENVGTAAEAVFLLEPHAAAVGPRTLEVALRQDYGSAHTIGCWRLTWSSRDDLRPVAPELRAALLREPDARSDAESAAFRALHRSQTPLLAVARAERDALSSARDALDKAIPRVMATRSVTPMVTRVLARGNWMDESGDVVAPAVPGALAGVGVAQADGERATRLDLARWLVDGQNPLVARVFVNRLWRVLMGRGLVRTLDDFGVQGTPPTHPELLDWLAIEFVDSGWDVRHVIRTIVTSSAYSQASRVGRDLDPGNRWYGRQERFRLDAEFVRDNALAASGLLVREVGGPSVRPYQPEGYWAHLNFPKRTYRASTGDDLYRRALYGHWQRQFVHPSLLAFDAPSRERCTSERSRSNTPQAALALLNDPIFVEAARALAQTMLQQEGATDAERVAWLWRRVLQRDPSPAEAARVVELVAAHRAHYAEHEDEAQRLLAVGASGRDESLAAAEHAAWTSAARVVLNLHETITRN